MLSLTHTAHGAILCDARGYVTHSIQRPGVGLWGGFVLYKVESAHVKKHVGEFGSLEAACAAAEKS